LRKYALKEEGHFNIHTKAYFWLLLVHYKKITFNSLLSCYAIIAQDKFAFGFPRSWQFSGFATLDP